ncbi:hypothetical protein [Streptomyces sp. NPDC026673]|uniref:hypothetical protein n=1 Tax=Streptomyces sp. NPDC026673 TaxID=3155724 RepID=UPI0033E555CE
MPGTAPAGRWLPRLAYGGALLSALTAHRFERAPAHRSARRGAEPMAALCGLDQRGFLLRCHVAGRVPPGSTPAP